MHGWCSIINSWNFFFLALCWPLATFSVGLNFSFCTTMHILEQIEISRACQSWNLFISNFKKITHNVDFAPARDSTHQLFNFWLCENLFPWRFSLGTCLKNLYDWAQVREYKLCFEIHLIDRFLIFMKWFTRSLFEWLQKVNSPTRREAIFLVINYVCFPPEKAVNG